MFYHINGVVTDIEPNLVVLECGGVGYALNASLNTISSVRTGERVKLYTYEIIREDVHDLYGFASKSEKHCFELLLAISGVGPKAALSMKRRSRARPASASALRSASCSNSRTRWPRKARASTLRT